MHTHVIEIIEFRSSAMFAILTCQSMRSITIVMFISKKRKRSIISYLNKDYDPHVLILHSLLNNSVVLLY